MTSTASSIAIVPYEDRHATVFRELNLAWIEQYFAVEELDRRYLFHPREQILAPGGAIWMAERDGVAVGCCALLNHGDGVYEVSKMAVEPELRGQGVGRLLLAEVIRGGRALGARRLDIISNTVLGPAITLYRNMGFREVPLSSDAYARGNIALELALD